MSNYSWYTLLNSDKNDIYSYESARDNLNNLYLVGYSNSNLINIGDKKFSRDSNDNCAYMVKLDDNGSAVWFHWIDGSNQESAHSIVIDSNYNVYLTGYSTSKNILIKGVSYSRTDESYSGFVIKFNQKGDVLWFNWLNGANSDIGYSMAIDSLNNIYISGVSNSPSILGGPVNTSNSTAGFLIKMNSNGFLIWQKWIDGINFDNSFSITVDSLNNIYVGGNSTSKSIKVNTTEYSRNNETLSVYLIKLDTNGNDLWGTWITGEDKIYIKNIICDIYNYLYIIGTSSSTVITIDGTAYNRTNKADVSTSYLFKMNTDNMHNVEWFKWVKGDKDVSMFALTTDNANNLYITGSTNSAYLTIDDQVYENMSSNLNGFLIKLNTFGEIDWSRWLFTNDNSDNNPTVYISDIIIDKNYNLYITGYTNATDVEFNDDTIVSKSGTNNSTYVFKYNLNNITLSEGLKSIKYVSNKKYIIYKALFYSLLFIVYIYAIWLIYKHNSI